MRKHIKGFIAGVVTAAFLMNGTAFGLGFKQNIEVLFNSVNLKVNGKPVQAENIIYNGTTYVPLRKTAEMLDKEVIWDGNSKSIDIIDKMNTENVDKLSENDVKAKLKKEYSTLNTIDFSVDRVDIQQSTAKSLGFNSSYDEEVSIKYEIDEDDFLEWIRLDRETKKEWLKSIYEFLVTNYEYPAKAIYFSIGYQDTYHSYPSSFDPSDISVDDDGFLVTTTIATFNNFNGDIDIDIE